MDISNYNSRAPNDGSDCLNGCNGGWYTDDFGNEVKCGTCNGTGKMADSIEHPEINEIVWGLPKFNIKI